jgi:DNA polymerase III alpha subunit
MWTETNTQQQLIEGVLKHGPDILEHCLTSDDIQQYLDHVASEHLHYPTPKQQIDTTHWFIPEEYRTMDILDWLNKRCATEEIKERVSKEYSLYSKHNMIPVLKTMKYIVDTLRAHNVVWGVGRGSSVASYVLHLIGVHKIDSIKYNIPIEEFFKGDQNG